MKEIKSKTSFHLPNKMKKEMKEKMVANKYSLRNKSKWICEAVEIFFQRKDAEELVFYASKMEGLDYVDTASMPRALKMKMDELTIKTKTKYPELEGLQSAIIRASIIQRVIRGIGDVI